jgi:cyclopropane-fatty-acyl-phospholipid synthase
LTRALARRGLFRLLSRIRGGRIEIDEGGRRFAFGPPGARLRATARVADPHAYSWALRGSTGLGEGFVDGLWTTDDLVALVRIACRNLAPLDHWRGRLHAVVGPLQHALSLVSRNTRAGATRHIAAHYDLGDVLFEAFLDSGLNYSCAYFDRPDASLEEAQLAKLERICGRLEVAPGDHLLEIGTGWGGLALHAAGEHGARVTTTTISRAQHAYASRRVHEEGLDDRVEVLLCDYRDLEGRYDKLVSIEMIEAVGWQYFETFFAKCAGLLRTGGRMLLQAIVISDALYEAEKASRTFANKHIFPGGCLPSRRLISQLAAASGTPVAWWDDITSHYPPTLAAWRRRFEDAWPRLEPLGYDQRFRRLWNFYLASSEAGFRESRIGDIQALLAKPGGSRVTDLRTRTRAVGEPSAAIRV